MTYSRIQKGVFLERPNRFVARVELGGQVAVSYTHLDVYKRQVQMVDNVTFTMASCGSTSLGTGWSVSAREPSSRHTSAFIVFIAFSPSSTTI